MRLSSVDIGMANNACEEPSRRMSARTVSWAGSSRSSMTTGVNADRVPSQWGMCLERHREHSGAGRVGRRRPAGVVAQQPGVGIDHVDEGVLDAEELSVLGEHVPEGVEEALGALQVEARHTERELFEVGPGGGGPLGGDPHLDVPQDHDQPADLVVEAVVGPSLEPVVLAVRIDQTHAAGLGVAFGVGQSGLGQAAVLGVHEVGEGPAHDELGVAAQQLAHGRAGVPHDPLAVDDHDDVGGVGEQRGEAGLAAGQGLVDPAPLQGEGDGLAHRPHHGDLVVAPPSTVVVGDDGEHTDRAPRHHEGDDDRAPPPAPVPAPAPASVSATPSPRPASTSGAGPAPRAATARSEESSTPAEPGAGATATPGSVHAPSSTKPSPSSWPATMWWHSRARPSSASPRGRSARKAAGPTSRARWATPKANW